MSRFTFIQKRKEAYLSLLQHKYVDKKNKHYCEVSKNIANNNNLNVQKITPYIKASKSTRRKINRNSFQLI